MAEPTTQEVLMMALINRARLDPAGEAARYGIDDILWRNDSGAVSIWDDGQIGNAHVLATIPNDWHIV